MKYIVTPILLFLAWKIWRDWQKIQDLKARQRARDRALAEFEALMFRLEMKMANGELTTEAFQQLREEALQQLTRRLQ